MDHVVARLEVGEVGGKRTQASLGRRRLAPFGGAEQILRTEDRQPVVGKRDTAPDLAVDQVGAGHGARQIGALGQVGGSGAGWLQAELKRDRILLQDLGQALELAVGGGEEGHAATLLDDAARLGDGHLYVALEGHGRTGGDVEGAGLGRDFQFAQCHLGPRRCLRFEFLPTEEHLLGRAKRFALGIFQALP